MHKSCFLLLGLSAVLLSGCSAPAPTYSAPSNADAGAAYAAHIEGLIAAWKPTEVKEGNAVLDAAAPPLEMMREVGNAMLLAGDVGSIFTLRSKLNSFKAVKVKSCVWGDLDLGEIKNGAPSFTVAEKYAYRCMVDVVHQSSERKSLYPTTGFDAFFYKSGQSYVYIPIDSQATRYAKPPELAALGVAVETSSASSEGSGSSSGSDSSESSYDDD